MICTEHKFLQKLAEHEGKAEQMSQGFTDLQTNVEEFQVKWRTIIDNHGLDHIENPQAMQLKSDVENLTSTLSEIGAKIKHLTIALEVFTGATAVMGILGSLCPFFWVGSALGAIGVAVSAGLLDRAQGTYDAKEQELHSKKWELKRLQSADANALEELHLELISSKDNFTTLITRLGAFAGVWASVP
ncbi:hypothetical protein K474DRAFT_718810 [Panus rudis PR-1116 ss-1]|nr:hypothetical protein K474DRAFT_718810 [Panus rudis PR-1116 ss-1]